MTTDAIAAALDGPRGGSAPPTRLRYIVGSALGSLTRFGRASAPARQVERQQLPRFAAGAGAGPAPHCDASPEPDLMPVTEQMFDTPPHEISIDVPIQTDAVGASGRTPAAAVAEWQEDVRRQEEPELAQEIETRGDDDIAERLEGGRACPVARGPAAIGGVDDRQPRGRIARGSGGSLCPAHEVFVITRSLGFDRRIDLAWVELAASLAASGRPVTETRPELMARLETAVSGRGPGSSRGKTVTILSRIWLQPPPSVLSLRDFACEHLGEVAPEERVAVHWALTLAAFPFFRDVAVAVGRLLTLQSRISLAHVHARLRDTWGERSTVTRAVPPVVATMSQWGLLARSDRTGVYQAISGSLAIHEPALDVLFEALLIAEQTSTAQLEGLISHPAAFPFDLSCGTRRLRASPRFEWHREGVGFDVVGLRHAKLAT